MTKLDKLMNSYYDALSAHKIALDNIYNHLAEMWGKSKKPKKIVLADAKNYTDGFPVIYNKDKFYVIALEMGNSEVKIHLMNHATDFFIADEICWYSNHDIKTLVIDEVSKHLGYMLEPEEENTKKKKKG